MRNVWGRGWLALPREAAQIIRINHLAHGLGERTPIDFQGVLAIFPKPARQRWLRRAAGILALAAVLTGTASPADAAVFVYNGELGRNGSGYVSRNIFFVVVMLILIATLATGWIAQEVEKAKRYRQAEADAWEAARYYAARADEAREIAQHLDADTARIERDIQAAYEQFEDDERQETRKHEAAKRALMARGDRS